MGELRLTKEDVGGLFVTRRGEVARVERMTDNPAFPFRGKITGSYSPWTTWTESGTFFEQSYADDMDDLIRRITKEEADTLTIAKHFRDL